MRGALKEISVRTPQYTRNSVSVNVKIPYIRSEGLKAARRGTSPAKNATAFPSQLCRIKALFCPAVAIGRACRNMRRQGWAAMRAIVCLTSRPITLSARPGTPWPPRFNTWVPALQEALDAPHSFLVLQPPRNSIDVRLAASRSRSRQLATPEFAHDWPGGRAKPPAESCCKRSHPRASLGQSQ